VPSAIVSRSAAAISAVVSSSIILPTLAVRRIVDKSRDHGW
jgi:hypothetical protein